MHRWGSPAVASATMDCVRSSIRTLPGILLVAALLLASPAGADEWSGPSELSSPTSRDAVQLVTDANALGDFVAAWKQSSDADIAAVLKAAGGSPGAPQEYAGDFDDPDVAIGGNSVGLLAFEDGIGSTSVHAASKASGSSSFTAATPFSGDGVGPPYNDPPSAAQPSVAVNDFGTGMLMFARDYYYPPSYTGIAEAIEGRILTNAATNTWNAGADLNADVYDPRGTEVSIGSDGSAFLGINHFNVGPCWGLDTAVLENNGTGSTDPDQFAYGCAAGKYNGVYPSNDRLPNNDIVMAYSHHDDGSVNFLDLPKARAIAGSSNLEASEVRLDDPGGTETTSSDVRVRTDAAGNTVVVWYDSDTGGSGNPKSMLARYRPSGGTWGPTEVISSGEDYSGDLDFDMDNAGNGYLVYERTNPGSGDQEIVGAERSPGASGWTTPELLSEGQSSVREPRVAAARNGEAFASWIANGNDGVFYARNSPPSPPPPPQCSDGADNDGDGKIDYPADPGCSSAADNDEADADKPDSAACDRAKAQLSKAQQAKSKAAKQAKKASKKLKVAKKKLKKAKSKAATKKAKKAKKKAAKQAKKASKKLKTAKKALKKAKEREGEKC